MGLNSHNNRETHKDLWDRISQGDITAFHELYSECVDFLYGYGMKFTNNRHFVEDTIHTLFVYIWEKREKISKPKNTKAYLAASYRNLIIKELNSQKRNSYMGGGNLGHEDNLYKFDLVPDAHETLSSHQIDKKTLDEIKKALDSLPNYMREVLYLRYFKHLDIKAIAKICKKTEQSVRNSLSGAVKKIRDFSSLSGLISLIIVVGRFLNLFNG